MRLLPLSRVTPGMKLGRDVRSGRPGELPLLRAGTVLNERYLDSLVRGGFHAVYVDDAVSEGIEPPEILREETRREAETALARAFADINASGGTFIGPEALAGLDRVAKLIAEEVATLDEAATALADLATADVYTTQHSIDVAALGVLIGHRLFRERGWVTYRGERRYDGVEGRLSLLGLGLLLHDVGKLAIPAAILTKEGPLDRAEWAIMRTHPLAGYQMLSSDAISPLTKAVVRSHHERWDGQGYPEGRSGEETHQFPRIAAVADVFDAITSARSYASSATHAVGYQAIVKGAGTAFDPEIVDVFREVVAPYPPGSEVKLVDGSVAVVADIVPRDPDRLVVRVCYDPAGNPITPDEREISISTDLAPPASRAA